MMVSFVFDALNIPTLTIPRNPSRALIAVNNLPGNCTIFDFVGIPPSANLQRWDIDLARSCPMDILSRSACGGSSERSRSSSKLNADCFCITLERDALLRAIERDIGDPETSRLVVEARPHLFSNVSVFLSDADFARMSATVSAIEHAARLPDYQRAVLSWAPEVAGIDHGPVGAMMGYDFHVAADGPKLIEINTNAGGAFLNALLVPAQRACCPEPERALMISKAHAFDAATVDMFRSEWRRQRGSEGPARIAIVDDTPSEQYLYPEMVLAKRLFQRSGIDAVIADPRELTLKDNHLYCGSDPVDLVYNRLVDFSLSEPSHHILRRAYIEGAVVLTPNPHTYALLADKRNLTLLSDAATLRSLHLEQHDVDLLSACIPHTVLVTAESADRLWRERKHFFFKPAMGYGSKGSYRGDKLTKGTWGAILKADYIAQNFASPGQRTVKVDGALSALKVDIRLYTYAGRIILAAARLYQGQTTNFRTPGGGFAPLFTVPQLLSE
ncbi:MAG: hypothetical protein K2P94_06480 [Rhodospirillaceae bacterium]|nr:hypothetical protein [Rhodospirillaceae bacterium]